MSNQLERLLFFIVSIASDRWPGQMKVKWYYSIMLVMGSKTI